MCCALLQKNTATPRRMIVEREQFRAPVLVPAGLGLEQKYRVGRRVRFAVRVHCIVTASITRAGTLEQLGHSGPITDRAYDTIAPFHRGWVLSTILCQPTDSNAQNANVVAALGT